MSRSDDLFDPASPLAVGPVVWDIKAGSDQMSWYFMVAGNDRRGEFHAATVRVKGDRERVCRARAAFLLEVLQARPREVHAFDDETDMAGFWEATWPCEQTRNLMANVKKEREAHQ